MAATLFRAAPAILLAASVAHSAAAHAADVSKPPPPVVVVILPGDKKVSDDLLQSMVQMKDTLRGNPRLEVLTYSPDAPSFIIAAKSASVDLKRLSTDDQRQTLAQALGANYWIKIGLDKQNSADITLAVYNASNGQPVDAANSASSAGIGIEQASSQALGDVLSIPQPQAQAVAPLAPIAPAPIAPAPVSLAPAAAPTAAPPPPPAATTPPTAVASSAPSRPAAPQAVAVPAPTINPAPAPAQAPAPAPVPQSAPAPPQQAPAAPSPQPQPAPPAANQPIPEAQPSPAPPPAAPISQPVVNAPLTATPASAPISAPPQVATPVPTPQPVSPPAVAPALAEPTKPASIAPPTPILPKTPDIASQPLVQEVLPPAAQSAAPEPSLATQPKQPTPLDDATQALLDQGDSAMARGDNAAAVEDYRNAVDESPLNAAPRVRLAQAYIAAGNSDAALGELQRAVAIDPHSTELAEYLQKAQDQHLIPGVDVLLLTVNAATKPADQQSQLALGDAYWNSKNLVLAEKTYVQAAQNAPDAAQASVPYARLARLYAATQRYSDCLKALSLSGSSGYSAALRIIEQQSDTFMGSINSELQQFSTGAITRTQLYDQLRTLDTQVSAFASFLGKITPPSDFKMSYLHRKLAANLMAQMTPNLLNYALTAQSSYLAQSQSLEHDALAELSQANAIDPVSSTGGIT